MKLISIIHTFFGVLSLISGLINLLMTKGTLIHRYIGWIYSISMYTLIFTSFFIYQVFGSIGIFHIMSILSGIGLTISLFFLIFKKKYKSWIANHYFWICYSYIGLVMATGSHFFDFFPQWPYAIRVSLFWGLPFIIGSYLIFGTGKKTLKNVANKFNSK